MARNMLIDALEPLFRSWLLSWLVPGREATKPDIMESGEHLPLDRRVWAQQKLREMGINTAAKDYKQFPPVMVSAVRDFQRIAGLYVDGLLGPQTWAALVKQPAGRLRVPERETPTGGAPWYNEAHKLIGVSEIKGAAHNPLIVRMFAVSGHDWVGDDETAWCAAFVNYCLHLAGKKGTGKLNARSFIDWGVSLDKPKQGAIAVFTRGDPNGWQGHVAFCTGNVKPGYVEVLGGNQSNSVNKRWYPVERLLGYRWPA